MDLRNIIANDIVSMKLKYDDMYSSMLSLEDIDVVADVNNEEQQKVINLINKGNFGINNYQQFSNNLKNSKRKEFLSQYTPEQLKELEITTYTLKDYPIGFALKDGYLSGVHNNSNIKGVGTALVEKAKEMGATKLDHFEGYLSKFYDNLGYKETKRDKWNDMYAPKDWNYDKYGKPDVVYRELEKRNKK